MTERRRWIAAASSITRNLFSPHTSIRLCTQPACTRTPVTISGGGQGMNPGWRRRIQIFLIVVLIAAGIRLLLIYRERHSEGAASKNEVTAKQLSADAYIVPRKVHAYDLQSARDLNGKTVWVQAGNQMLYFPFDPA